MKFLTLSVFAVPLVRAADLTLTYEDLDFTGAFNLPAIGSFKTAIGTYRQLIHANFGAAKFTNNVQPTIKPIGLVAAAGGSTGTAAAGTLPQIMVDTTKAVSFLAKKAYFGSVVNNDTPAGVTYPAEITVTAYKTDGSAYRDLARCNYIGGGQVQECVFPSCWAQIAKMTFQLTKGGGAGEGAGDLGQVTGAIGLGGPASGVLQDGFLLDNLLLTLTCVGGTATAVDGTCP